MQNKYIRVPDTISFNDIKEKDYALSSSQFKNLVIKNKGDNFVNDFLSRPLNKKDLGNEVGSINYIEKSPKLFLRTKALQSHSYIPEITEQTCLPIQPSVFVSMNLKEGDILISKDSNIGEIVILDKDYPNVMLSSAIYRIPVVENKYYLLACIKHDIFREQLDFLVPKGATIRHAKTKFLDCQIPLPNTNKQNVMKYVEQLTKAVVQKEISIKKRHQEILSCVENEIIENQKTENFNFSHPRINELETNNRFDATFYSEKHKEIVFKTKNYKYGYDSLDQQGLDLKPGPSLEIRLLGTRIDSEVYLPGFYRLITPKQILNYGTIKNYEYIGTPREIPKIEFGDILFGESGTGRTMVYLDEYTNTINNAHAHILRPIEGECTLEKAITIRSIMQYYKEIGLIDCLTVGGSGGHLSPSYFDRVYIPNFPESKQKEIAKLYYNPELNYDSRNWTLDSFLVKDLKYNEVAGIYELDKTMKLIKDRLDSVIDQIVNNENVEIKFDFD